MEKYCIPLTSFHQATNPMLNWCIVTLLYNYNLAKDTPSLIQLKLFFMKCKEKNSVLQYASFSVCVKGAAGVYPPYPSMKGCVSV